MDGSAENEAKAAEGGAILGRGAIQALEKALQIKGAICGECGRTCYFDLPGRTSFTYEFLFVEARVEEGKPKVVVSSGFACERRECGGREKFRAEPNVVAVRRVPSWEILNSPNPDEPPSP